MGHENEGADQVLTKTTYSPKERYGKCMENSDENCYIHLVLTSISSGVDASTKVNGCEMFRIQEANGEKRTVPITLGNVKESFDEAIVGC